ncbi:MAG: calcium/sodium antiporter [Bdellovibrionales bacterium]|nr:calcium/sodium antiporter [Bdellovibrionales bacterium]
MSIWTFLYLLFGIGLLTFGAEALVRGSSRLAALIGISPLVIGLTVVAFGTSAPELAISVRSALFDQADISIGNVVGSNILNILLILGACAVIQPLEVHIQLIRVDVPIMIAVSFLFLLLGLDGHITFLDGSILFLGLLLYIAFSIRKSRDVNGLVEQEFEMEYGTTSKASKTGIVAQLALSTVGLVLLVFGADLFVKGATEIARAFGVSELVIGLTIVALGTSLPEVATSVVAALKGQRDIAIGNAVGSNIFNLLSVVGISALAAPKGLEVAPAALNFDIPVMIAVALGCFPIFYVGSSINRWEGALFLFYYLSYTAYLILQSSSHSALPIFSQVMLWFVVPLTVITLVLVTIHEIGKRKKIDPS